MRYQGHKTLLINGEDVNCSPRPSVWCAALVEGWRVGALGLGGAKGEGARRKARNTGQKQAYQSTPIRSSVRLYGVPKIVEDQTRKTSSGGTAAAVAAVRGVIAARGEPAGCWTGRTGRTSIMAGRAAGAGVRSTDDDDGEESRLQQ